MSSVDYCPAIAKCNMKCPPVYPRSQASTASDHFQCLKDWRWWWLGNPSSTSPFPSAQYLHLTHQLPIITKWFHCVHKNGETITWSSKQPIGLTTAHLHCRATVHEAVISHSCFKLVRRLCSQFQPFRQLCLFDQVFTWISYCSVETVFLWLVKPEVAGY